MDLKNILNQIEQADPEVFEKISPRRHILQSFGSKVAVAAIPFALGSLFSKAYGKKTTAVIDVLNFALQLEYLEYNFYYQAVNTPGLIDSTYAPGFVKIMNHEKSHVDFLKTTIATLGTAYVPANYVATANADVSPTSFDFTAGGTFPTVFSSFGTFLAVSQTFEDTGVRAYKGAAPSLQGTGNQPYLEAALRIHSAEARHASFVRLVRRLEGMDDLTGGTPRPWITQNVAPVAAVNANYSGESLSTQLGVDITSLPGVGGNISANAATQAFDEPLDMGSVVTAVTPFFTM